MKVLVLGSGVTTAHFLARARHEVAPESTTVEVTLHDTADGTRVVLRHRGLPEAAMAWGSQQGWR